MTSRTGASTAAASASLHRDAALHVAGAAAVDQTALDPGRQVRRRGERHGVEVAGQHHALAPPEARCGRPPRRRRGRPAGAAAGAGPPRRRPRSAPRARSPTRGRTAPGSA
nr:hypothetical protein [Angustibacter aerolatus]